ncbi:hypothetical protein [Gimesia panareensis]|uniref:hypothetical protein n=1 Tax=Gimesia panareensis TaxID=2527978 RepID=UPI00118C394A|nr:hypothetical protein [Gimesia panareensis]QDU53095.1 hypothetical protein Pan110_54790 [Gimesia panareensis]
MSQTGVVHVNHGISRLAPSIRRSLLKDIIEFPAKEFSSEGNGRIPVRSRDVRIWRECLSGQTIVLTGLIPAIVDRLEQSGVKVEVIEHRRFPAQHKLRQGLLKNSSGSEREFLLALKNNPIGQIEVNTRDEVVQRILEIAHTFPKAKILIRLSRIADADNLCNKLRLEDPELDASVKPSEYWPAKPSRVLFTCGALIGGCDNKDWDIILLPDPAKAVKKGFFGSMRIFRNHPYRCYSFVLPSLSLCPPERLLLEAISGQVIYSKISHKSAVQVLWQKPPSAPVSGINERCLKWKQDNYWKNDRRNDYIAGIARAFVTDNHKKLKKYGVPFHQGKPHFTNSSSPQVVVLVESQAAGLELQKRLPGWELKCNGTGNDDNTQSDCPERLIITTTQAALNSIDADVLIYAAGGQGVGALRSTIGESETRPNQTTALIIELADGIDKIAVEDVRDRRRGYAERGWKQSGSGLPSTPGKHTKVPVAQEASP